MPRSPAGVGLFTRNDFERAESPAHGAPWLDGAAPVGEAEAASISRRGAAILRFAVAAAIAGYVLTFQPLAGERMPGYVRPAGLLLAADLVVLAIVQSLSKRAPDRAMSMLFLLADLASPVAALYLFAFDPRGDLFVLLIVAMAQGALVLRTRGAVGAWAICSFAYLVFAWRAQEQSGEGAIPIVVSLRVLIMLFIALLIAQLTSRFEKGLLARRRVEQSLAYQARILSNVNDAVLATNIEMRITSWNPAAEDTYGWTAEEVIGRPLHEVLRPRLVGENQRLDSRDFAQTGVWSGEFVHLRKDGRPLHVEAKALPMRDDRGDTIGYVTVNRDITERRRVKEAARNGERCRTPQCGS